MNATLHSIEQNTDWRAIDRQLRTLARRRAALDAEEARCLREAERLCIWRELGYASMLNYMEQVLGYGPRTALERLRVARALDVLPSTENALMLGAIPYSTARELTRVATFETEQEWLAAVANKNLRQVEELVAGRKQGDLPEDPKRPELIPLTVRFDLSADTFALLRQTRIVLEEECGHSLDDDQLLTAICRRALDGEAKERGRAVHQIAITKCDKCNRGFQDGGGVMVEISPEALELAHCDAEHIGSLDAEQPTRAVQDITPMVRRFIWHRDHGRCRVPGCRSAKNIDIHHIVTRADGGSHKPQNLILCCSAHHTAVHLGLLTITGTAPNDLVFESCDAPTSGVAASEIADAMTPPKAVVKDVARSALVRMGFRSKEALDLVNAACAHVGTTSLEAVLLEALRRSGG